MADTIVKKYTTPQLASGAESNTAFSLPVTRITRANVIGTEIRGE